MLKHLKKRFSQPYPKAFYSVSCDLGKFEYLVYYKTFRKYLSNIRGRRKLSRISFLQDILVEKDVMLNGISFNMLECPAGGFFMGSEDQQYNPLRFERIEKAFLLGETEVKQELYLSVMGKNPSSFKDLQRPVEKVSWFDAIEFCNKLSELQGLQKCYILTNISKQDENGKPQDRIMSADVSCLFNKNGYRLPTEKEWEYAAKAGTRYQWSGTDDPDALPSYAVYKPTPKSQSEPKPTKSKKPNPWGFYDMSGNVEEWCWDRFELLSDDPDSYAVRGGGWSTGGDEVGTADVSGDPPDERNQYRGFRVCRSIVD